MYPFVKIALLGLIFSKKLINIKLFLFTLLLKKSPSTMSEFSETKKRTGLFLCGAELQLIDIRESKKHVTASQ